MDDIITLTPLFSVAPQLTEESIAIVSAQGFRSLINNRYDGESPEQPSSAALQTAAERHGLAYHHLPVISGAITDEEVEAFGRILAGLDGPVLAFCRSGARSTMLWALHEAGRLNPELILHTAAAAGFNLFALRDELEARWRAAGRP